MYYMFYYEIYNDLYTHCISYSQHKSLQVTSNRLNLISRRYEPILFIFHYFTESFYVLRNVKVNKSYTIVYFTSEIFMNIEKQCIKTYKYLLPHATINYKFII